MKKDLRAQKKYLRSIILAKRAEFLITVRDRTDELQPVWIDWVFYLKSKGTVGGSEIYFLN